MIAPSQILWQLLVDFELVTEPGLGAWPAYIGFMPDEVDDAVGVFDTAGLDQGRVMGTGERIVKPGIQIVVRALDYATAYSKIKALALFLDAMGRQRVWAESDVQFEIQNVSRQGDILPIGMEPPGQSTRRRFLFSLNGIITYNQID